ncbi:MAG: 23S rRNA (guanosine(2251)-2'-O)-methyltransferase RlmB [Acidobacteriota bacterium]|nr:23S rRNA (guanosine(2251)-2'-O)-methyltransferase RlmB [Blastocatellia bacterium]MDW8240433.1 23S rRNA (guanosine(2251)-2'-O)-methyltransferase RlmB [Acidobacteriota bacterium]
MGSHPQHEHLRSDRPETQYIWGRHSVLEALRSGRRPIHKLYVAREAQDPQMQTMIALSRANGALVQRVERSALDRLTNRGKHQGVVAVVAAQAFFDEEALFDELTDNSILVVLDQVQDPHNLGAIIRTAHCAGVDAVIITKHRSSGLTDVVAKTAAGALEYTRVVRVTNLATFLERLKQAGFQLIGVCPEGQVSYTSASWDGRLAIIFGSEGKGLRRLTKESCHQLVCIPMRGKIDSLNVSVAVGVVLFEAIRRRNRTV